MRDQIGETDDLDLLLDSALATYADPGPGSGLEDRVLGALAKAHAPADHAVIAAPRLRWLPWAIGIPVAAGLILLWLLASTRVEHAPSTQPQQAYQSEQPQLPSVTGPSAAPRSQGIRDLRPSGAKAPVHSSTLAARLKPCPDTKPTPGGTVSVRPCAAPESRLSSAGDIAGRTPLPKLDVFPTPQPLTEQEQSLLAFAQQAPARKVEALSAAQAQDEESFSIAAAHIPLFEPPAEGKN
jgi:hypothetical protein